MQSSGSWRFNRYFVCIISTVLYHCGGVTPKTSSLHSTSVSPSPSPTVSNTPLKMPIIGGYSLESNENTTLGYPHNTDQGDVVISRSQYVVGWSDEHRSPRWVSWRLTQENLGSVKRQNNFAADPDLADFLRGRGESAVEPHEFKGSCFDRGHQAPSGDRTATQEDNTATFYMSNMLPQTAYINRQPWRLLEEYSRSVVRSTGEALYIVSGPIYDGGTNFIGPNHDIAVPSKNFKIIVALPNSVAPGAKPSPRLIASVIMPNVTSIGTDPVADREQACSDSANGGGGPAVDISASESLWRRYEVPLEQVEQESGLDFNHLH